MSVPDDDELQEEARCPKNASVCPYTVRAADQAVKKVFAILGVDVDKPESVEEFRADLRFGKKMRKAADHGQLVFWGAVALGMTLALWDGLANAIKKAFTG